MCGLEFRVWQAFVFGLKLRAADAGTGQAFVFGLKLRAADAGTGQAFVFGLKLRACHTVCMALNSGRLLCLV